MKHAPIIRLQATRAALDSASRECAHWDQEGADPPSDGPRECCYALDDAKRAHRIALRAWQKTQ